MDLMNYLTQLIELTEEQRDRDGEETYSYHAGGVQKLKLVQGWMEKEQCLQLGIDIIGGGSMRFHFEDTDQDGDIESFQVTNGDGDNLVVMIDREQETIVIGRN